MTAADPRILDVACRVMMIYIQADARRRERWFLDRQHVINGRQRMPWLKRAWLNFIQPVPEIYGYRLGQRIPCR